MIKNYNLFSAINGQRDNDYRGSIGVCVVDGKTVYNIIPEEKNHLNLLSLTPELIIIVIMYNFCNFKYFILLKTHKYTWLDYYHDICMK